MSTQALNSEVVRAGLKDILLNHSRAVGEPSRQGRSVTRLDRTPLEAIGILRRVGALYARGAYNEALAFAAPLRRHLFDSFPPGDPLVAAAVANLADRVERGLRDDALWGSGSTRRARSARR